MEHGTEPSKSCTKCGVVKPFSEFPPRNNRYHALQPYCRSCGAEMARKNWERKSKDPYFRAGRVKKLRVAFRESREQKKCGDCGIYVPTGHAYCEEHREERRVRELARRAAEKIVRKCIHCGSEDVPPRCKLCEYCAKLPDRRRLYIQLWIREQRLKTFEQYGGAFCACCGEEEPIFLTIDHINNDGSKHRRAESKNGTTSGFSIYRWLKKHNFPPGFQVLCYNCNSGKYRNGGKCPHEEARELQKS